MHSSDDATFDVRAINKRHSPAQTMENTIKPRAPFDFEATARFLRYTESEAVDTFKENQYRRAFHLGEKLLLLSVASTGTRARPALVLNVEKANASELEKAAQIVAHIFSTQHDLKKFRARVADDPLMSKLEAMHRGLHIARWPTLFEALAVSILSQQISTSVAMTIKRRLVENFGERLKARGETFFAFPLAERVARARVDDLRALGLSGAKVLALQTLAREVESGAVDESELAHEENGALIERLTALRGIGRWTAEWALMLYFGRTDIFPAGDLALKGFVVKYYNDGVPMAEKDVRALAEERWGEWASYAAVYFLAGMRAGIINLKA